MTLLAESAWLGKVRLSECDARPGRYYVTARDEAGRTAFLLGPFVQPTYGKEGHARANGWLKVARQHVADHYPRSMGWTFGTAWKPLVGRAPVGNLNEVILP